MNSRLPNLMTVPRRSGRKSFRYLGFPGGKGVTHRRLLPGAPLLESRHVIQTLTSNESLCP
jgi:hypothetical protein